MGTKFFAKIDSNHDGKLSFTELLEVLKGHPAYSMCETEETFQELMEWNEQRWGAEKRRVKEEREEDAKREEKLTEAETPKTEREEEYDHYVRFGFYTGKAETFDSWRK